MRGSSPGSSSQEDAVVRHGERVLSSRRLSPAAFRQGDDVSRFLPQRGLPAGGRGWGPSGAASFPVFREAAGRANKFLLVRRLPAGGGVTAVLSAQSQPVTPSAVSVRPAVSDQRSREDL